AVEDSNNSKSQEVKALNSRRLEKLQSQLQFFKSSTYKDLDISIEVQASQTKVQAGASTVPIKEENLCSVFNWLNTVNKGYEEINDAQIKHLESSRKSYSSFNKKFSSHLKGLNKKAKGDEKTLLDHYFEKAQFRELYNIIHNLQSLPSFLLTIEALKSYTHCQILAHEKGQGFATSIHSSLNYKTFSRRTSLEGFNKVFQSIKKSKSKIFQSEQYDSKIVEVIGTFLAHSFSGDKYNLVLILGRNGFLPPAPEEFKAFEEISTQLEPVFNAILRRSSIDDKISNIIDVLEAFHLPLAIFDKSERCLFQNETYEHLKDADFKDFQYLEKELQGKNILRLYFKNESREDADLYHFYRVSLLGELLNTLRHELSNPLFGLSLATDMLETDGKDDETVETIQDIKTNSDRCQTIIKNFSSLYEDEDNFKEFDLISLLNETIILTKSETKGIKKEVFSSTEELLVFSNPTWISQVVFNLIINAGQAVKSKFGYNLRDSFVKINVSANDSNIILEIIDNGPGVPEEHLDKLFAAFFTTKESGTGLGLSICKNLMNKLGGDIAHTDTGGEGTKFLLTLPFEKL
ncbi:MAG: HAMP domain-containing histidine kinase, partial [Halobacteriovoraceae bacterium]|nr:HAMP domain-containing histidine kinase [Halobacteriovoraceae bacterium]